MIELGKSQIGYLHLHAGLMLFCAITANMHPNRIGVYMNNREQTEPNERDIFNCFPKFLKFCTLGYSFAQACGQFSLG